MGWRYNPPPNWPQPPPGWTPPPGWQPDPAWGPPPDGHQFWLHELDSHLDGMDDQTASVPAHPAAPDGTESLGNGLAITALILAVVSLFLSWVPIINNGIFFTALLALAMGIPALVILPSRRAAARAMAFASIVVAVLAIAGVLLSQLLYESLFS